MGWATLPTPLLRLMLLLRASPRSPPCPHCQNPPRCPAHLQERPHLRNPAHHRTCPHPHCPGCFPGCCHPSPRCLPCPSCCSCCCPSCHCCLRRCSRCCCSCCCPNCPCCLRCCPCCPRCLRCCPSYRCLSSTPNVDQYLKVRENCTLSRVQ